MIPSRCARALLAACALSGALTGCASSQGAGSATSARASLPEREVNRLTSEFIRSLDTRALKGHIDSFLEKWSDDLDHTVALATMRNKEELREFLSQWSHMFSRWRHVETRRLVQGNFVAWEGIATGTHRMTGKPLELPMVMIMEFDADGRVRMSHVYFDSGVLQQQLLEW